MQLKYQQKTRYEDNRHQERNLLEQAQQGDTVAQGKLVQNFQPLVFSVIQSIYPWQERSDDMIQDGNIWLLMAIRRFNLDRNNGFWVFAKKYIKNHIFAWLASRQWPVHITDTKTSFNGKKVRLNLLPTKYSQWLRWKWEIKDPIWVFINENEMTITREALERLLESVKPVSLYSYNDDWEEYLACEQLTQGIEETIRARIRFTVLANISNMLQQALAESLKWTRIEPRAITRMVDVILARYWVVDGGSAKTLESLSQQFGVTTQRIQQIEVKALRILQTTPLFKLLQEELSETE